jgi:hypothetical protein
MSIDNHLYPLPPQAEYNDHLTEELKEEVDKCSPKEGDRDVESGCMSEAGLQRLKNICEILFKKNREFSSVHQLCQFAARLGSKCISKSRGMDTRFLATTPRQKIRTYKSAQGDNAK